MIITTKEDLEMVQLAIENGDYKDSINLLREIMDEQTIIEN
jgi:hypothetical protein